MPDNHPALPEWLEPVRRGALDITADELTRFVPPEDENTRVGAVLMLFGEGPAGPDLLLTERAHDMRSHPGQVSFPGGSLDPDGLLRPEFRIRGLPGVLFVDADGRITNDGGLPTFTVIRSYDQLTSLVREHLGVTL